MFCWFTYDRPKPSHLKSEVAADAVPGARDEGHLAGDAALLAREEAPPGDPEVDEDAPDEEDEDVPEVDESAVEGDHALDQGQVQEGDDPGSQAVSPGEVESGSAAGGFMSLGA